MKFLYEYRTSDNERHFDAICAADKAGAYAALKARGIKPARVTEAPGFFNALFGKGKRWMVIGVLGALCLVLCAVLIRTMHNAQGTIFHPSEQFTALVKETDAIVEKGTNDVVRAREELKELFRRRYAELADTPREREEAEALYGRATLLLDVLQTPAVPLTEQGTKHQAPSTNFPY